MTRLRRLFSRNEWSELIAHRKFSDALAQVQAQGKGRR